MTVPAQLNLSGVISVMMRFEFSRHTYKSLEMSKCIGHKYGQWNRDKWWIDITSNGCSVGKFAHLFSSSRDPTFVLIGCNAWVDELVHRFPGSNNQVLMRMRQILPVPSGIRMEAVAGVTSSLWTLGPRRTFGTMETYSGWACRWIKNR